MKKTTLPAVFIMSAFCALTAGCTGLELSPLESYSSNFSKFKISKIIIAPFEAPENTSNIGLDAADLLSARLVGPSYDILDRQWMDAIPGKKNFNAVEFFENKEYREEIRRLTNSDTIMLGKIYEYSEVRKTEASYELQISKVRIYVKLVDIESGIVIWSCSQGAKSEESGAKQVSVVCSSFIFPLPVTIPLFLTHLNKACVGYGYTSRDLLDMLIDNIAENFKESLEDME
jgi:hypothetical protein